MQDALKQNIAAIQSRHRIYKNSPKTAWVTLKLNNVQTYMRQRSNKKKKRITTLLQLDTYIVFFPSLNTVFYPTAHIWSGERKIRLWMAQEEVKTINLVRMRCLRRKKRKKIICPVNIGHEIWPAVHHFAQPKENYWTE